VSHHVKWAGWDRTCDLGIKSPGKQTAAAARNGNVLQDVRIGTATSCRELQGLKTTPYARSYARSMSRKATPGDVPDGVERSGAANGQVPNPALAGDLDAGPLLHEMM
jgi:hypothetical protein